MELRPYQQELILNVRRSLLAGHHAPCAVLGCGGGKSCIAATIARSATNKGNTVLFLVHRRELCDQITGTFSAQGVDMNLCDIMMVQTACRRLDAMRDYAIIITDECQHATAASYKKIYEHYPQVINIGFTATPIRLNRGGLGEVYDDLIPSVSTKWLIDNHYLAPYKYYSVKLADASGLHCVGGDYKQNEVAQLMQNNEIYGDTVTQWRRLAEGKKTIAYCASVESAQNTAREFICHGYMAASIDGKTEPGQRREIMQAFRAGDIKVLTNCELFGEGLDVPDCECVILLRPTQSLTLFVQQSMRSMRYLPGKTAIIIDHVGNCYRHGLPDDDREWSLAPKKKQENTVKIRECQNCFAVYPPSMKKCPYCGYEATTEVRTVNRKTVEVDLVELERTEKIKNTRLSDADLHTWDEVVEFQRAHKYKFLWTLRYCINHGIEYPAKYRKLVYKLNWK